MKTNRHSLVIPAAFLTIALFLAGTLPLTAQQSDPAALEIIRRIDAQQTADTSASRISMHVYPNIHSGESRDYYIESFGKGDDVSYMEFIAPRSIKGMKILSTDEEVRVYFPSTGRVRRITGSGRGGSVGGVGGDFSYEDMGGGSLEENYTFSLLSESSSEWALEGLPTDPESSYNRVVFFIDRELDLPVKIEYYTPEDGHRKTMIAENFTVVDGRNTATLITMTNHRELKKTVLKFHSISFDVAVDDKLFNPQRFYR